MSTTDRLQDSFNRLQQWDLRVGEVWLHPKQVAELGAENNHAMYDRQCNRSTQEYYKTLKGALLVGWFLGACVFASEIVVENHVVLIPAGFDGKLVDGSAGMPF